MSKNNKIIPENYKLLFFREISPSEEKALYNSRLYNNYVENWEYCKTSVIYNLEYFKQSYENNTLIIFKNHLPVFIIPSFTNQNSISWFENPTKVFHDQLEYSELHFCYSLIKKIYLNKKYFFPSKACLISNHMLVNNFFDNIVSTQVQYLASVDLNLDISVIYSNIRKSYKSLINWGEKFFKFKVLDHSSNDYKFFIDFKRLHFLASNGQTRSDKTWDIQLGMIKDKKAFLILAYQGNELLSGVFIQHDKTKAFYGVSASNRNYMKDGKSLTHSTLWYAIKIAKEKKIQVFDFGNICKTKDIKLNNINLFKKGFCTQIQNQTTLKLSF